ncbi:MAG: sigma 54-interacting transcriptional regulator [Verrucomicrobiae bacterium]|nr:sigma 54-interacting transcriptional regulator [Verrucomicrobiae bacterium]
MEPFSNSSSNVSVRKTGHPETGLTQIILESVSDGVFTIDHDWRITSFNRAAEEITGIPRREAVGRRCSEVFRSSMCEADCALRHTMKCRRPVVHRAAYIIDACGRRVPISLSTAVLRDGRGKIIGGVETFRDLSALEELRKELEGRFEIGDLASRSVKLRKILEILPQIAAADSAVLIEGETGVGKEIVARAIHAASPRRDKPFVAVNAGALPDALVESELFGYKAGAFTGATKDKPGRFAAAEGGTLFLDEIGEISPAMQVRLLRVLQNKIYEPLGANQSVKANVRIIAATNRNLPAMVKSGAFRQDLYYRLNVVHLRLPPLRERKEDIPLLVERFIAHFNRLRNKNVRETSPETMAVLMAHDYPGNVRELENIIEHAFILCDKETIELRHLPEHFYSRGGEGLDRQGIAGFVRVVEAQAIREAIQRHHGSRLEAARALGMHKSTLFRKLKALGIVPPSKSAESRKSDH